MIGEELNSEYQKQILSEKDHEHSISPDTVLTTLLAYAWYQVGLGLPA
jgi:hypothetical protein